MTRTDQQPRRSRFTAPVLAAIVTLALVEGAVRLVEPRLPAPGPWPTQEYGRHESQMAQVDDPLETLVVGSSIAGVAIRPEELPELGRAYNHWLAGPGMRSVADLTRRVLLDRADPRRVVVGVTMREFNDGPSQLAHYEAMVNSDGFREQTGTASWIDRADKMLRSTSAIAANRESLRDPVLLVNRLRTGRLTPERIESDGHLSEGGDQVVAEASPEHTQQERDSMARYTFSVAGLRALDQLLVECQRRNIEVVVVNLPVTEQFIGFANGGIEDQRDFENRVRSATERRGGTWVDTMNVPWADEWFADVSHLNDRGGARLRPRLAQVFSPNGEA